MTEFREEQLQKYCSSNYDLWKTLVPTTGKDSLINWNSYSIKDKYRQEGRGLHSISPLHQFLKNLLYNTFVLNSFLKKLGYL